MKDDEYVDMFFKTAKEMGYTIETCKRGKGRGQLQINFGNKKLHANHIKKLHNLIDEKGISFSYNDFEEIVPGRPCAVKGFRKISQSMLHKC